MANSQAYTAANAFPMKMLTNKSFCAAVIRGGIAPLHLQFFPTNRCNSNCGFCSCANRDKTLEMGMDMVREVVGKFAEKGMKAVTITGGGEPLMHPDIEEIFNVFAGYGTEIGLVSNGILLSKVSVEGWKKVTWCRVSVSDERKYEMHYVEGIREAVRKGCGVDWAFSYVVGDNYNIHNILQFVQLALELKFTHVRLVSDILSDADVMGEVKALVLKLLPEAAAIVIFQSRAAFDKGMKDCRISLLKPLVGPDGKLFPCCGVQYAHDNDERDMVDSMCMGTVDEMDVIWEEQRNFDGSECAKCYYTAYNTCLSLLHTPIAHADFV